MRFDRQATHAESATLISLFAGAGGMDLGLESAGFTTVAANEIEPHTCRTLVENQRLPLLTVKEFDGWFNQQLEQRCYKSVPESERITLRTRLERDRKQQQYLQYAKILNSDIRELSSDTLASAAGVRRGEATLVAGGPPCQPFSRAGKRETVEVEDGRLFLEFVRVVSDLSPRWFLFENVKGLLLSKTEVVRTACRSCGIRSALPLPQRDAFLLGRLPQVVCACGSTRVEVSSQLSRGGTLEMVLAEFERIGYHCTWKVLNAADFGIPQQRERLFIVGSRDNERFNWPSPTHTHRPPISGTQVPLFKRSNELKPWSTLLEALWPKGHPTFGSLDHKVARLWVKNVVRPHDEPVTWELDRPSPTIGAHQGAKLALAPDGVPEEQLIRQQWHVKGRRQRDLPPVSVKHEYLSDLELMQLQTFPSNWYFFGTRMERAFQIGNAVPVTLARVLGSAILSASSLAIPGQHPQREAYGF